MTPYLEKVVCEKPDRARGLGYLLGRYGKNRSTPLSPQKRVFTNEMKQSWQLISKSMDTEWKSKQNTQMNLRDKERTWVTSWFISLETKVSEQTQMIVCI